MRRGPKITFPANLGYYGTARELPRRTAYVHTGVINRINTPPNIIRKVGERLDGLATLSVSASAHASHASCRSQGRHHHSACIDSYDTTIRYVDELYEFYAISVTSGASLGVVARAKAARRGHLRVLVAPRKACWLSAVALGTSLARDAGGLRASRASSS
jgi:hypothetical protein